MAYCNKKPAVDVLILLEQGRQLFGDPDARTEAALTGIHDIERIKRMALAVLNVKSWKALLSVK